MDPSKIGTAISLCQRCVRKPLLMPRWFLPKFAQKREPDTHSFWCGFRNCEGDAGGCENPITLCLLFFEKTRLWGRQLERQLADHSGA